MTILRINIRKTKVMCTFADNNSVKIGDTELEFVNEIKYLGKILNK